MPKDVKLVAIVTPLPTVVLLLPKTKVEPLSEHAVEVTYALQDLFVPESVLASIFEIVPGIATVLKIAAWLDPLLLLNCIDVVVVVYNSPLPEIEIPELVF